MRLFLLPISTRQSLIYCQRLNEQLSAQTSFLDKITTKASATWLNWEQRGRGWQKRVTDYGNKLFQRLPYEEWALKSVPPLSARKRKEKNRTAEHVVLEYPDGMIKLHTVKEALQMYQGKDKQGFHMRWLLANTAAMPLTLPIGAIPVLPNLPFFYLSFRAWSHWRARCGSQHLEFLSTNDLVKLTPSALLRIAYIESSMTTFMKDIQKDFDNIRSVSTDDLQVDNGREKMLLTQASADIVAEHLKIPELAAEIKRAVWQVEKSLKAKQDSRAEMRELKLGSEAHEQNATR